MRVIAGLTLAAILGGCASTPDDYSDHEHQLASRATVYAAGAETPAHSVLGSVESNSCDSETMARYAGSEAEAIQLLKLEAVRLGGDMVVSYTCSTRAVDLVSNCWASKRCSGQAARRQ